MGYPVFIYNNTSFVNSFLGEQLNDRVRKV
jgi:hypothetical protein